MGVSEHLGLGGNPFAKDWQLALQNAFNKRPLNRQLGAYNKALDSCAPTMAIVAPAPLDACLKYFRALGLTDEQIRVAITPVLFDEVRKLEDEIG